MSYGSIIREAREARAWPRELLAVKAGVAYTTVIEVERGAGNPRLATLARVARALDLELSDVLATPTQQTAHG